MSDPLPLNQALGTAYAMLHQAQDREAAVALLRQAAADHRDVAVARREELAAVVKARSMGGRCGCYVSQITHDLLSEALDA